MAKIDINQKPDNSINIILNYPNIEIINPKLALGKIESTFNGKPNEPNVIYSNTGTPQKYKATNLYIYGKLHNIKDLSYNGELIIKNTSLTNNNIIYTIFLLKTDASAPRNTLDTLISSVNKQDTSSKTLDINNLINNNNNTYIVYSNNSTTVIINTNVINIKTDLSNNVTDTNLFNANPENYSIVKPSVIEAATGYVTSGIEDETEYVNCESLPIDSETELSYVIPSDSSVINSVMKDNFLVMMMTYIYCFFAFLIILFLAPIIYRIPYYYPDYKYPGWAEPKWYKINIISSEFLKTKIDIDIIKKIFTTNQGICYTVFIWTLILIFFILGFTVEPKTQFHAITVIFAICYTIGWIAIKNDKKLQDTIETGQLVV